MNEKIEASSNSKPAAPAKPAISAAPHTSVALEMQWNALLGEQDLLREEIRRGKECLLQTQSELAESRSQLEEWPAYERRCGGHCLPRLTESVAANRRVERFLNGWLKRRQNQLAAVNEAIARYAKANGPGHLS